MGLVKFLQELSRVPFTIWFAIGFSILAIGTVSLFFDYFSEGRPDFPYSSLFVLSASLFALHVLEINVRQRREERREDASQAIINEISRLCEGVERDLHFDNITALNLRVRNAVLQIGFIDRLIENSKLTDFDKERALFYRLRMAERVRANINTVHPAFFFGDIYEAALGAPYSSERFRLRPNFYFDGDCSEVEACEIKLKELMRSDALTGMDFLYYGNGEDLIDKLSLSGPLNAYVRSFQAVWASEVMREDGENE